MNRTAQRLHTLIAAVAPIEGVAVGGIAEVPRCRVQYLPEATAQQRNDGDAIASSFDPDDSASQAAWEANLNPERKNLRAAAAAAIQANQDYLAINSPTNAQNVAQMRALTQQVNRLISRLIQID